MKYCSQSKSVSLVYSASSVLALALALGGCASEALDGPHEATEAGNEPIAGEDQHDGPRLFLGPVDPSLPVSIKDEALTGDPAKDPVLTKMLAGAKVRSLRPAKLRDMTPRSSESVMMVTEGGVYEAEISYPDPPEGEQVVQPESIEPRGWSDGVDNRTRRTPPTKVGMVAGIPGQCSGALIGLRVVRTAAHCIVPHTTGGGTVPGNTSVRFDYQRNGTTVPVSATSQLVNFGGNYISAGCARSKDLNGDGDTNDSGEYAWGYFQNTTACANEDWALLTLPDNWWGAHGAASFGYRMPQFGDLGVTLSTGGYPSCTATGAPASCVTRAYYEDRSSKCKLNAYLSPFPHVDMRRWKSGCDTSAAMSGGPAWERSTLWFLGHVQWEECLGANCGTNTAPNHYLGHNQWLYDFQGTVRANSGRP